MTVTYKERIVFGEGNTDKVKKIIEAKYDPKKLIEISPSFIVMDLTWRCNYNCICCIDREAVNRPNTKDLPIELIEDIFDYSHKYGVRGIMTMGGEVFLYKKGIEKALEKSVEYQIPLKTVTNGSRLKYHLDNIVKAYKIPGSVLRVSLNSNKENYQSQIRTKSNFDEILSSIREIISRGTPVFVSTVVFPESSRNDGTIPNISYLTDIVEECKKARVNLHILLPSRDPTSKRRYELNKNERSQLETLANGNPQLNMLDLLGRGRLFNQNLDYCPCPSGLLFTLIGSDGKIYKCTDNRGRESAVLGEIKKRGDFERFWHSEERANKQISTLCQNKGCIRYKVNVILDDACRMYRDYGVRIDDYLKLPGGNNDIFI